MKVFMPHCIFEHIKHYLPHMQKEEKRKKSDTCWKLIYTVEDFNNNKRNNMASSVWKGFDGFMSAFLHELNKHVG